MYEPFRSDNTLTTPERRHRITFLFFASIDICDTTIRTLGVYGQTGVSVGSRTTAGSRYEPATAILAASAELWAQGGPEFHVVWIYPTTVALAGCEAARSLLLSCSSVGVASAAVKDAPGAVGGCQVRHPSNDSRQLSQLATPMAQVVAWGGEWVDARVSVRRQQRRWTQRP